MRERDSVLLLDLKIYRIEWLISIPRGTIYYCVDRFDWKGFFSDSSDFFLGGFLV